MQNIILHCCICGAGTTGEEDVQKHTKERAAVTPSQLMLMTNPGKKEY